MANLHFLEKGLGIVSPPHFTLLKGFELFQIWDCTLRNICNIHQVMFKNSSANLHKKEKGILQKQKKKGKIGLLKWHSLVIQGKTYEYITRIYIYNTDSYSNIVFTWIKYKFNVLLSLAKPNLLTCRNYNFVLKDVFHSETRFQFLKELWNCSPLEKRFARSNQFRVMEK